MAVGMFLKIDEVTGEPKDKVHGKEIDVLAWNWGMGNNGSAHFLGGVGSGKVNVQDWQFLAEDFQTVLKDQQHTTRACDHAGHKPTALAA